MFLILDQNQTGNKSILIYPLWAFEKRFKIQHGIIFQFY